MKEKIKPELTGSAQTMLQSFYARAQYSKKKNSPLYDAKALEIVEKLDFDFSDAARDAKMGGGVAARTIVLDGLVKDFIEKNPDCTVVNIACGLDTRFYRVDNGRIRWYNLDLPETINIRNQIFEPSERVSNIGISVLDPSWTKQVDAKGKVLFIIEGLSMYLTREENARMLSIIKDHFENACVIMECLAKKWVSKEKVEKSIQKTGAKFLFGADCFADLKEIAKGFHKIKDDNIIRGMTAIYPASRLVAWLPALQKATQKILIFEKDS
jgi:O-methyltransferase involved in polyketide biosynthesis